jgi:NADPH-dependent glutamate synthase beta subunit-like oxidoreductase/NAD-dependent dihydropyrimidine dehydrogenase PreA subunit
LSAAYYLLSEGHAVTIYESHQAPGGMMRYGIPAYRLPRDVMDQEVEPILKMGGKIEYNTTLGQNIHFADLQKQKFDAYFIATGAQLASAMRVPGENLPGVMSGIDFLARVSEGEKLQLGQTVLVIGGGNTAIDAARTSRRLGANDVAIIYRRTRNEMPAYHVEVEDAVHEGVTLTFLMAPVKVEIQNGRLALHVIRMELGAPDASGRQRPVPVNGSEHVIMADTIISAIGQAVDPKVLDSIGLELTKWGSVKVDAKTFATNIPGIFAGGDCVTGPDLAVRAVGAGRLAAIAMDQYLRGEKVVGAAWEFNSSYGPRDQAPAKFYEKARPIERAKMPEMAATTRTGTFDEVASGFPADVARQEALRCLECRCNKQHDCTLRDLASEYQIDPDRFKGERRGYDLDRTLPTMVLDVGKCINCGTCARICESVQELYGLGFTGRGFTARIKPPFRRELTVALQETCQKCIESCPCGALSEPSKNSSK